MLFLLLFPARAFDVFTSFPGIDVPMHFLGGVAAGFFFHRLCLNGSRLGVFGPYHVVTHAVLVFGLVCAAAVFWEFGEFMSDRFLGTRAQRSNADTMADLLLDVTGGMSFLFAFALSRSGARRP
jgi:methyl coenzyme M reductase beta subunit